MMMCMQTIGHKNTQANVSAVHALNLISKSKNEMQNIFLKIYAVSIDSYLALR